MNHGKEVLTGVLRLSLRKLHVKYMQRDSVFSVWRMLYQRDGSVVPRTKQRVRDRERWKSENGWRGWVGRSYRGSWAGVNGFRGQCGVTPRNLTLRPLRTTKPPHRLREAFRLEEYVTRKGFLPWRLRLVNLNRRIGFEIEGKGHGHSCPRITTILIESFSKGHETLLRRFYRRIDRGKVRWK